LKGDPDDIPDIRGTAERIQDHVIRTPLLRAAALSEDSGASVHLKLESLQRTGSFKLRGAASRLTDLTPDRAARGVVTCSSGNHGKALAHMAEVLEIPARIFVPEWVDPVKAAGMARSTTELAVEGATFDESEARALRTASEEGLTYVSAYDDPWVISGQGTIGLELAEQLGELDAVLVPLSGGGLVAGIALALQEAGSEARIVAVSAENAAVMRASVQQGRPVEVPEQETLANALAGGIGPDNRLSFELVRELVDEHLSVSEDEIAGAMCYAARDLGLIVEGGGAVGLAACLAGHHEPEGTTGIVVSGGNVDPRVLLSLLG